MNLRTLMQVGPAKANELFARLAETSDGAVKTREMCQSWRVISLMGVHGKTSAAATALA